MDLMVTGSKFVRVLAASALGLVAAVTPMIISAPAQAADNGSWSAAPKADSRFTPRQFFFFEASPGQTINDAVDIKNSLSKALALEISTSDAVNTAEGGAFAPLPPNKKSTDVGAWTKVPVSKVVIPARGRTTVPFKLTVPKSATPGDHAGLFLTTEPDPSSTLPTGSGSSVQVQRSLGVRIYIRVAGPLTPALAVSSVKLQATPAKFPFIGNQGNAVLTYRVTNTGNVRLAPTATIKLSGFFGRNIHSPTPSVISEVLPGQTVLFGQDFQGMPSFDQVQAKVTLTTTDVQPLEVSGTDVVWVVSWLFVAVVVAFLILLIGWILVRRRVSSREDDDDLDEDDGESDESVSAATNAGTDS